MCGRVYTCLSAHDTLFVITFVYCAFEKRRGLGLGMQLLTLFRRNAAGGCGKAHVSWGFWMWMRMRFGKSLLISSSDIIHRTHYGLEWSLSDAAFQIHIAPLLRIFCFNASCQFTPLLNLRALTFRLTPVGWLRTTFCLAYKHHDGTQSREYLQTWLQQKTETMTNNTTSNLPSYLPIWNWQTEILT
jgi:hypothetical protein